MNGPKLVTARLTLSRDTVLMTGDDFSEPEALIQPFPTANHPYWQPGHLCEIEVEIVNSIGPRALPDLPDEFRERFSAGRVQDDAALSGVGKQDLVALFGANRQRTIVLVRQMTSEQLDAAAREDYAHIAPHVAHLLMLILHQGMMHAGQMQVARRKLGRPILF